MADEWWVEALLDPSSHWSEPADILTDERLDHDQKLKLLRRWEYDARELSVATEENMPGPENADGGNLLDQVLQALVELGEGPDNQHPAPTKQGGV